MREQRLPVLLSVIGLALAIIAAGDASIGAHLQGTAGRPVGLPHDSDDSVRCRMSGICDGPPLGSCPGAAAATGAGSLGPEERDALLACIRDPAQRAEEVLEATAWSWKGYRDCAWGEDELQPLSCQGQHWLNLSLTMVDSLDTLYLVGLKREFEEASEWVVANLDATAPGPVNLFETTIRIVGGLLSAHYLCRESHPALSTALGAKAAELGERLLPAFSASPSGIPYSDVNLRTGKASAPHWAKISSLSEISTLSLEFTHLARLTGRPEFEDAAMAVHSKLTSAVQDNEGLLPLYFNPESGRQSHSGGSSTITLGARSDSYYEYLLKQWLLTGKSEGWLAQRYVHAVRAVRSRLVRRTAPSALGGLLYVAEEHGAASTSPKMDHLVCFLPGLLALGDFHGINTIQDPLERSPLFEDVEEEEEDDSAAARAPSALDLELAAAAAEAAKDDGRSEDLAVASTAAAERQQSDGGSDPNSATAEQMDGSKSSISGDSSGSSSRRAAQEVMAQEGVTLSDMELAEELATTCYEMYRRTPSGLAPEIVHFEERAEAMEGYPKQHKHDVGHGHFNIKPLDAHNLLRPEAVESLYILWKVTGRQRYRDWAWAVFRAFQRWCRVEAQQECGEAVEAQGEEGLSSGSADGAAGEGMQCRLGRGGGYTSLQSVLSVPPPRRDKMESFWVAETLKYLYLIFTEPAERCMEEEGGDGGAGCANLAPKQQGKGKGAAQQHTRISLQRFVFNTEAHPLPVVEPRQESTRFRCPLFPEAGALVGVGAAAGGGKGGTPPGPHTEL